MRGASAPQYGGSQGYGEGYQDQAYDDQAYGDQGYGQGYAANGYDGQRYAGQGYGAQGYGDQDFSGNGTPQGQHDQQYDGRGYGRDGHDGYRTQGFGPGDQGYGAQGFGPGDQGYADQGYGDQGYADHGYADQGYADQGYPDQGYADRGYADQGYPDQGYPDRDYADQPTRQYGDYGGQSGRQNGQREPYMGVTAPQHGLDRPTAGDQPGFPPLGPRRGGRPGAPGAPGAKGGPGGPGQRKVRLRRTRRFFRRPTVRVISAILGVFLIWAMFSAGQAAFKNNGQGFSANLAEWARDHYLGPVVTFGEWLSYNPPKSGGEPTFAYTVPKNEQITTAKGKHHKGAFVPDIPLTVKSLAAGTPLSGEGQWRVIEKVKGEPAILSTFLRDGGQYTSYSNGIASIDQRLVKFSLRPGTEDPGPGNWGVSNYIPQGQRTGLLATFNGGFKLDAAGGGFYLNGLYHGSLVNGAASIVYYKNGTVRIGEWGRDFHMNSSIEGVRQNLQLLVDHGKVSPNANGAVNSPQWGATLGGGAWVWRSGIGITKDHRIIFVYGQALDAQDLADLLQRAGVVEGMQMDINPAWMKFDYYQADGHPSDPTPVPLLPAQQPSPYSYYTPSTRDFTAVYAR